MIFSTCIRCQRSSNPRRQNSMPVALPTWLQIPCRSSFHHCFVPQLRAQLFTYHHLQPSLPSFPYLCFNRRITSVGAHPGELIFSKHLAFFFIFVIFYIFVIFNIFHIFVIFSIFSIFDIFSIFVIFDILLLFDIYITKSKFTYI
jgi:hypothetical protein